MANVFIAITLLIIVSGSFGKKHYEEPTNLDLIQELAKRLRLKARPIESLEDEVWTAKDSSYELSEKETHRKIVPLAASRHRIEKIIDNLTELIEKSPKGTQKFIRVLLDTLKPGSDSKEVQREEVEKPFLFTKDKPSRYESPLHRDPNEEIQETRFHDDDENLFPPTPEEDYHIGRLDIEPRISKAQIEYFQREVLPDIIPDDIKGTLRERLGKHLAYFIPLCVTIAERMETLPKAIQEALLLPLQYMPGGRRYSGVNHGNARGMIIDLSRPKRNANLHPSLNQLSRQKRETEQEKVDRLLGLHENQQTEESDNDNNFSSKVVTYLQGLAKVLRPWEKFFLIFPKYWFKFIAIPFTIYFSLPSIRTEAAEWYIQPLPVRIVQALFPLFARGDWNVLLFIKVLFTPLPIRILLALWPHATGPFRFPKKFVGLLPSKALPHRTIRLPDGDYKRIGQVIPYLLQWKYPQIHQYIYDNIMKRLPPKLKTLRYDLGIPTVVKKPWQILGLFPRFFPEGPENNSIKVALLLARIGAPLVFITFFLNPFNVPGAILLGLIFTLPALFTFNPLRWLNPIIVAKVILGIKPFLPIF